MNIFNNKKGLSRIELFCTVGICIIIVALIFTGIKFYRDSLRKGNDGLLENTVESVARGNYLAQGCVINGCPGGDKCTHNTIEGNVGYFNNINYYIEENKPHGYNQYHEMKVKDIKYHGKIGTMVIKVIGSDKGIELSWVEGENK
ncbi:MAG: hypothetical protein RR313_11460 [Anaerovoracaceae bacterium]